MAGFWDFFGGMAKEGARDLRETHEANEKLKRELSFQEQLLKLQDELEQRREQRKPARTLRTKDADGDWVSVAVNAWNQPVSEPMPVSSEEARQLEEDELLSSTKVDKAQYEVGKGRELAESALNAQINSSKASAAASYQNIAADRERISDADRAEEVAVLERIGKAREDAQALIGGRLGNDPIPALMRDAAGKPAVSEMHKALKDLKDAQDIYTSATATAAEKNEALREIARLTSYIGAARANMGVTARDREQFKDSPSRFPDVFEQATNPNGYGPRRPQE